MRNFVLRAVRRNYGPDKEYYRIIDDLFGFIPHNIELYKLALIHKSASFVLEDGQTINNERLEFLGDAVIEAVTSDYLYIEFPDRQEGFLTQLRSKIVSRQSLNTIARTIGLDRHVIANSNGSGNQKHIFGDAFEAMIGAIYLDMGYDFVNRLLINRIYYRYLDIDSLLEEETDFKSRLIEWCQKNHHSIAFETVHGSGYSSNHPVFDSTVLIDGICVGHGQGESKKEAEQHAASSVSNVTMNDETVGEILDKVDRLLQSNRGNVS
ncbi:ribonuclease III [uncultured Alistipes sp.]|uniref:ribonuclease III n=1 Tax=uncultured Alistipes sp. TaxID=538949 RepID=UPI002608EADC|nr:ribonuclease III [uncultured Alistipes sp.]